MKVNPSKIFLTLFFLLINSSFTVAQHKVEFISADENSFEVKVNLYSPPSEEKKYNKVTIRNLLNLDDFSKKGKYKLYSPHFVFAIPPKTVPNIKVVEKKERIYKNVIPSLNAGIKRKDDSTLVPVTTETLFDDSYTIPKDVEIENYFWYRDFYCVSIKINAQKYYPDKNEISEINEIKLKFKFKNNEIKTNFNYVVENENFNIIFKDLFANYKLSTQFRSEMPTDLIPDTTAQWIDFDADYIKISIVEDGIYRFYGTDIIKAGYNLNDINPGSLKLFESGKELHIVVNDGNDGSFDESDYIEFWGHKNYPQGNYKQVNSAGENYNEYENRYTDTAYYFLTWSGVPGKRLFKQNEYNSFLTDTLNYFKEIAHFEQDSWIQNMNGNETENQMPNWHRNKTWYWNWIGYWSPNRKFIFQADNIVPGKNAKAFFKATTAGLTSQMRFKLSINDVQIDSQNVGVYTQVLLNGEFNSSILNPGNNTLNAQCFAEDGNYAAYDWYEINYPKLLNFENDSLKFEIYDDVQGEKIIKINNAINSNYLIYKISPIVKKIVNYVLDGDALYFTDTVKPGDKFLITSEVKVKSVKYFHAKRFKNYRSSQNQADYIAITHKKFSKEVNDYLGYISKTYSLTTFKADVFDIYDEFSYGYPYPEAIKLFLYKAYTNWKAPKVATVTLIGDASYDYKEKIYKSVGVKLSENFVPSYGFPVGDYWYAVWDEDAPPIPQLKIGRIPIRTGEELYRFLSKLKKENEHGYDSWNKRSLFFSGGDANSQSELNLLRGANEEIINNFIKPPPYSGKYTHFYKTSDPVSDFGPYTPDKVNEAIEKSGVFIAYLGHSGTATWDNGINSILHLKNSIDRYPLITDFGCSTNKFAEPDIISFGERFLLEEEGTAIGYVGNSSLGFFSTAINGSKLFYEKIIADSLYKLGDAHLAAKVSMFNLYGSTPVNKIFAYSNTLLGEPAYELKIPPKPNLSINGSSLISDISNLNENADSVSLKIIVNNFGLVISDSVRVKVTEKYYGKLLKENFIEIPMPKYADTLDITIYPKDKPGLHTLNIFVDNNNLIDEIYEDDNNIAFEINVFSTSLRDLTTYNYENGFISELKILNPVLENENATGIQIYISDNEKFDAPQVKNIEFGSLYTKFNLTNLFSNKRYWYKLKLNYNDSKFGNVKSFFNNPISKYLVMDSIAFLNQNLNALGLHENKVGIVNDSINVSVLSAGALSGATCLISVNGENLLSNTFLAGMGVAVFDSVTMNVDTAFSILLFQQPDNVKALAEFIDSIPSGKIVAMGVMDDARNNMSNDLRNAIKTLGSTKIDSLQFRGSWALIGYKNAPPENVIEEIKGPYDGQVFIDTTYVIPNSSGKLITTQIGPAFKWQKLFVTDSLPSDSKINYRVIGIKSNSEADTLGYVNISNGEGDLSFLNNLNYKYIKVLAEFNASSDKISPALNSLGVNYTGVPELGINYQVVSIDKDSVEQGENVNLSFYVYNVGESPADSFKVKVDLVKPDNSSQQIFEQIVDSLGPEQRKKFNVSFNTVNYKGAGQFNISIDADSKILELYEDNNFYSIPFYVHGDTTKPSLNITFDGQDIFDGEYISATPDIKIEMNDPSLVPINDTSAVTLFLNDEPVYYSQNQNSLNITFSNSNPKVIVNYRPTLKDGEYTLTVFGKDASGNVADSAGVSKSFVVDNEAKLLNLYNYPNPFAGETHFTFKLTQIPDEIKIKIYTIAGRLVKQIRIPGDELDYDFNKIYWDGRDEDGDLLANGVYIYKVILYAQGKTKEITQKLAIVR